MPMARYSNPEIEQDSALATRAKADRLVIVAMFEAGKGSSAITACAAQS